MRSVLKVLPDEPVVLTTIDVVYSHRMEFCEAQYIPLMLSLVRQRNYFPYDKNDPRPLIVFLCGGAWIETDHNAWLAELAWFAKHGYDIASIQYPVTTKTRFPESIMAVKTAIRFLRSHHEELRLSTDKIVLMGESAGGYLAALCAAVNGSREYDKGEYPEQDSNITAAIAFYPPDSPQSVFTPPFSGKAKELHRMVPPEIGLPIDAWLYPSIVEKINTKSAPLLIIHGLADDLVASENAERIYAAMQKASIRSELLLIESAQHADCRCFQPEIKERILAFLRESK
jgi:acetyl esterase/lipase